MNAIKKFGFESRQPVGDLSEGEVADRLTEFLDSTRELCKFSEPLGKCALRVSSSRCPGETEVDVAVLCAPVDSRNSLDGCVIVARTMDETDMQIAEHLDVSRGTE